MFDNFDTEIQCEEPWMEDPRLTEEEKAEISKFHNMVVEFLEDLERIYG